MVASAALVFTGCAVGPNHSLPNTRIPASFGHSVTSVAGEEADLRSWWRRFKDPVLDSLIEEATSSNHDLKIAAARMREARAMSSAARGFYFPSVGANGAAAHSRLSGNSQEGMVARGFQQELEGESYRAGFDLGWELDVFGGVRRSVEAARAEAGASEAARGEWMVSVLAEVGLNYMELRGGQKELRLLAGSIRAQEDFLKLTSDRMRAGVGSELEVARADARLSEIQSMVPPVVEKVDRAIHRLGVLTGHPPVDLKQRLILPGDFPSLEPVIPTGLPSDLLRRRPDIRRAERELASATARVGIATAELFPKFYLTGAAGLQSVGAGDLVDGGSRFWTLGPSVRWPIFNAGRLRQQIKAADARQEQSVLKYEKTVLGSLEEVENSLVTFGQEQVRLAALTRSELAGRRALELAKELNRSGVTDYLAVLDAERSHLAAEGQCVQSERLLAQHLIRLYKALGGGWDSGHGVGGGLQSSSWR